MTVCGKNSENSERNGVQTGRSGEECARREREVLEDRCDYRGELSGAVLHLLLEDVSGIIFDRDGKALLYHHRGPEKGCGEKKPGITSDRKK